MAIKQLALIAERDRRKKKKVAEATPIINKPTKEVVKNKKGTTYINRDKISTKPSMQNSNRNTYQNRVVTNKERLTSKPAIGAASNDIRTVKGRYTPKKKYSTQIVDIYERDGRYYYQDGKKEKEIDNKFVQNALKNNRTGVIGRYDSRGKLKETDEKGNVKTAKGIRREKINNLKKQASAMGNDIKSGKIDASQMITDAANLYDAATDFGLGKVYKTAAKNRINAVDRLWTGSTKALENVMDTANDLTSEITARQNYWINRKLHGMSKQDAKKEMEEELKGNAEWVSKDLVDEFKDKTGYNNIQPSLEEGSFIKKDNLAGKVLEGVGGMLPSLAVGEYANLGLAAKSTEGLTGLAKAGTVMGNMGRSFLNQAGANAVLTASSYGSGLEEAYRNGATGKQARMYGLLNAATELSTEWITGGIPGTKSEGVLDDIVETLIDKKTAKISNRYVSNVINAVVKSQARGIGEGIEEALAEIISPHIKNLTYSSGEKVDWNQVKDSALSGYFVGMVLNSPETISEIKKGINDAKISPERKQQLKKELDALVEQSKANNSIRGIDEETAVNNMRTQLQQQQANEVAERVNSGEIEAQEGNALLNQVRDGTYQQNRNLEQIATEQKAVLEQQLQQGQITPEEYTQEVQALANTVNQTREEINTPKESTQESTFNNEIQSKINKAKDLMYNELSKNERKDIENKLKVSEEITKDIENKTRSNNKDSNVEYRNVDELINKLEDRYGQRNYEELDGLITLIKKQGVDPIIINNYNGERILDGNHRILMAKELGLKEIPVKYTIAKQKVDLNKNDWYNSIERGIQNGQTNETTENVVERSQNEQINNQRSNETFEKAQRNATGDRLYSEEQKYFNRPSNEAIYDGNPSLGQESINKEIERTNNGSFSNEQNKGPEILDKMPTTKNTTIQGLKKGIDTFRKEITDRFAPVYDMARKTRNMTLYHNADRILASDGIAQVDLGRNQVDLRGKPYTNFTDEQGNKTSMSFENAYDLYNKIPVKAKNEFLVNQLNIDRLNQGVEQFEGLTYQQSEKTIAKLKEQYPDIDKWSENIYQYYRNLQQKMVDNGRIPQSLADEWQKTTPHYVHIQRQVQNQGNTGVSVKNGKVDSDNLIRKVKGGDYAILPIKETTAKFTQNASRAFTYNDFGKEYARTIGMDAKGENVSADTDIDEIFGFDPKFVNTDGKGNYTMKIYENGTPVEIPISKEVYDSLGPQNIPRVGILADATNVYKDLLTNKNPFFGFLRNPIKDAQDMFLYSKHPIHKSIATYTKLFGGRTAFKNRTINGVKAQDIVNFYHNTGNAVHSIYKNGQFETQKGGLRQGIDKVLSPIEKGNDFMESMPRITEFWNTIQEEGYTLKDGELVPQKGKNPKKTVEQVIAKANYDAADVTVNFKRGGRTSKVISQNGGIFFNPSVQGTSKFTRNITEAVGDARAGDYKAAKRLVARAAMLGVAPALLSAAMYDDDDEYKDIQDYQKDQYYLIKGDNGKWIRIPKGRALSLFQSATRRGGNLIKGDKDAFKGYGQLVANQIAPNNPLDNNILSPITSAATNKSWSGNKIVSDSMSKRPKAEQFNEKTDEFSKWVGKQLNISPMKVNYVIDQYSGVLGDLILPQITPKSSTGSKNPVGNILRDNYSFDAANSNKSVNDFYDIKNKVNTKANSVKPTESDKLKSQFMNTKAKEMYGLYTKKQEIQMDNSLSKKEKYDQALEVQKQINKFAKEAVNESKKIKMGKNTATVGDSLFYKNSKGNWSQENEETAKKRKELGLSPEKYYYYKNDESYTPPSGKYSQSITSGKNAKYNIAMVDAFNFDPSDYLEYKYKLSKIRGDKDSRGRTIRYSARNKKIAYLNTLPISATEKAYLMKQNDRYYRSSDESLKKAINNSSLSKKEKQEIYSYLGLGR